MDYSPFARSLAKLVLSPSAPRVFVSVGPMASWVLQNHIMVATYYICPQLMSLCPIALIWTPNPDKGTIGYYIRSEFACFVTNITRISALPRFRQNGGEGGVKFKQKRQAMPIVFVGSKNTAKRTRG